MDDSAKDMFGKVMSIPDELMWDWYLLLTDLPEEEIERRKQALAAGGLHPKALKQELGRRVAAGYHGEAAAQEAQGEFEQVFAGGGLPEDIPEVALDAPLGLAKAVAAARLAPSNKEAWRLVQQGAVSVDGERRDQPGEELAARDEPYLLKVGKRRFARLKMS